MMFLYKPGRHAGPASIMLQECNKPLDITRLNARFCCPNAVLYGRLRSTSQLGGRIGICRKHVMRSGLTQTNFKGDFGMQKKLISVAVAGALFAPALALGQTSTVQIYGRLTYEFGFAEQVGRPDSDFASSPGGSAIGFKGEEKLGGNLSAWFQCETSADTLGNDQIGLCSRNSAVGFKGGFGNVYFGRWDTPFKRALNQGTVGAEE